MYSFGFNQPPLTPNGWRVWRVSTSRRIGSEPSIMGGVAEYP